MNRSASRSDYSETAEGCKQQQQQRIRQFISLGHKETQRLKDAAYLTKGQCVAEDDPRLEAK
jgi:hypothetical protein